MGRLLISMCYCNQVCTRIFIGGGWGLIKRLYMFDFKNYIIDNIP